MKRFKTKVFFSLLVLVAPVGVSGVAAAEEWSVLSDGTVTIGYDIPRNWTESEGEQRAEQVRAIIESVDTNRNSITTFRGTFRVETREFVAKDKMNERCIAVKKFDRDLYRTQEIFVDLVADANEKKTFRHIRKPKDSYEYLGAEIDLKDEPESETICIDSPRKCIYVIPNDQIYSLPELPGHRPVPRKDIGVLVTPGYFDYGDIPGSVDPFERMETPLWMLSAIVPPREKDAPSDHHRPYKNFRVYEAVDAQGVRWIRCQYRFYVNDNEVVTLWRELASGYVPAYKSIVDESQRLKQVSVTHWTELNGMLVPVESECASYFDNGNLQRYEKTEITDIRVNEPLDQKAFSYEALGLTDGCLVLNTLDPRQSTIFKVRDGKLVYVAKEPRGYPFKYLLLGYLNECKACILTTLLVVAVLVGAGIGILRIRARRRPADLGSETLRNG